jgi:hypothetical protein
MADAHRSLPGTADAVKLRQAPVIALPLSQKSPSTVDDAQSWIMMLRGFNFNFKCNFSFSLTFGLGLGPGPGLGLGSHAMDLAEHGMVRRTESKRVLLFARRLIP